MTANYYQVIQEVNCLDCKLITSDADCQEFTFKEDKHGVIWVTSKLICPRCKGKNVLYLTDKA